MVSLLVSSACRLNVRRSDGAGEAKGAKERGHLRRDGVDRAGDDADDRIQKATNDGKTHETTSLSEGGE